MIGVVGDYGLDLKWRELSAVIEGKRREYWNYTSSICSLIYNSNCTKKSQLKSPKDFNPFENEQSKPLKCIDDFLHLI